VSKNRQTEEIRLEESCDCCCCMCHCSREQTKHLSMFGCLPIKCGLVLVGIFTLVLNLALYVEVFYFLLNDNVHWWYVIIAVLILIPLFLASTFFVVWFSDDNNDTRGRLDVACYMSIISIALLSVWNIIYFLAWYKANEVFVATPTWKWVPATRKQYLFWTIFWGLIIIWAYGYWICVARRYWYALKPKDAKKADEKKADGEKADDKKEEAAPAENMMMGDDMEQPMMEANMEDAA
jgi:hypothetical protein